MSRPSKSTGRWLQSTMVRNAIAAGNVDDAMAFPGASVFTSRENPARSRARPNDLVSHTKHGAGTGTASETRKSTRRNASSMKRLFQSITNVGTRPTFNGHGVTVESHLFEFDQQISEGRMEVYFHERLRTMNKKFFQPRINCERRLHRILPPYRNTLRETRDKQANLAVHYFR